MITEFERCFAGVTAAIAAHVRQALANHDDYVQYTHTAVAFGQHRSSIGVPHP